jgi:hypothetical protein
VGSAVIQQLTAVPNKFVEWSIQPPSRFPDGQSQVVAALRDEQTWVAVTSKFEQASSAHFLLDNDLVLTQLMEVLAIALRAPLLRRILYIMAQKQ